MTQSPSNPVRLIALNEAGSLIAGLRDGEYGDPTDSFRRFSRILNEVLGSKLKAPLDERDAAAIGCCLKLSRLAFDLDKLDSWRDLIGYAALGFEMAAPESYQASDVPDQPKNKRGRGRPRKRD
jgi:hypothetical protein